MATSTPRTLSPAAQPPFLRLPTEIRLQIYGYLVLPQHEDDLMPSADKAMCSSQDYFDYEKQQFGTDRRVVRDLSRPTLLIRTIKPEQYAARRRPQDTRTAYSCRNSRFRPRCMETTYHCVNSHFLSERTSGAGAGSGSSSSNLGILGANRQIHREAAEVLYGGYTFDFDTHIEAVVPFLADRSAVARAQIRSVRVVKRALPYDKEYDRYEWADALGYLSGDAAGLRALRRLELGVVAGRPGNDGWLDVHPIPAADFAARWLSREAMIWLHPLLALLARLHHLDVHALVEHCPPVYNSDAMLQFVRFSASIEDGFADFLRGYLLTDPSGANRPSAAVA